MRSPPTRILITGATGFLGRAVVAAITARPPDVDLRLLVRDRVRAERAGLPAAALLVRPETLAAQRSMLRDVDVVLHLAGAVRAARPGDFLQVNAGGTADLLAALPESARVVLVSSLAAAGPSVDGRATAAPPDACRPCSCYGESKRQAELALLADAARTARPWLVLRPSIVYGPGDGATDLLFRQATAALCPVPWRPRPLSAIYVRDVVVALLAALQQDVGGAFLPLAGATTDSHALMEAIAHACGRRARLLRVPDAVAVAAGHAADLLARARGAPSYFSRDKVREITAVGWVADREPARRALGFSARSSLEEGLAEVAAQRGGR